MEIYAFLIRIAKHKSQNGMWNFNFGMNLFQRRTGEEEFEQKKPQGCSFMLGRSMVDVNLL